MKDITNKKCPILYALDIIGQKWKLPILWYLHEKENTRYNELKRRIPGITNIMLTKSLRELEEKGLVIRTVYETIPPKVEYSLTQDGKDLLPTLNELYKWGEAHMEANLR
ncbi:MAG: helix-turn-helix transcriptional regulator [Firmicutes bacterium]|nr:helix-turn-helix transcriptional regulator [Bacillota bacterium]